MSHEDREDLEHFAMPALINVCANGSQHEYS